MNFRINKFKEGIKTDPFGTLLKAVRYSAIYTFREVWSVFETILYFLYRVLLAPLPAGTLAKLKNSLNPSIRLDYKRQKIFLSADSEWSIRRARACNKEPETVHWIENFIRPGEVLYDVGANVGAYSLIACKYFQHNIIVHAFEPSFSTYYQLSRNIFLNECQDNVFPHLMGLTEKSGFLPFHFRSLEAGSADHWFGDNLSAGSSTEFEGSQFIQGYAVDDLIESLGLPVPNHIKLDVDGTEVEVLRGAEKTLQLEDVKSILVEVRDVDGMSDLVNDILLSKGFHLISKTDRGDGVTWNCIYARRDIIE